MALVKVLEVLAESDKSWDDAARKAVAEAAETVRGIQSVYVSEFQATVENNQIRNFRLNAKVSFLVDRN
jgi:dodecin